MLNMELSNEGALKQKSTIIFLWLHDKLHDAESGVNNHFGNNCNS